MFTKNHFNNLQDMVTLYNDNGNWKNALKAYDSRKKQKGRKIKIKIQKFFKPPLFLKVKEFLLSFLCARFSLSFSFICKQNDKQI